MTDSRCGLRACRFKEDSKFKSNSCPETGYYSYAARHQRWVETTFDKARTPTDKVTHSF